MNNFKLLIEYDGTNYFGWQIQPQHITVQGVIKEKLEIIFQENINLQGASRTDAKVHARGQVANFFATKDFSCSNLKIRLNKLLPDDIRIIDIVKVGENFNARKDAIKKTYKYYIYNREINSPFYRNYSWHINREIDIDILNRLSSQIIGEHNFLSFSGQKCSAVTFERIVFDAKWIKKKDFFIFTIIGNGFLKNMVRKIVGAIIAVNNKQEEENYIAELLEIRDRAKAKYCAPPQGLFLESIFYL